MKLAANRRFLVDDTSCLLSAVTRQKRFYNRFAGYMNNKKNDILWVQSEKREIKMRELFLYKKFVISVQFQILGLDMNVGGCNSECPFKQCGRSSVKSNLKSSVCTMLS